MVKKILLSAALALVGVMAAAKPGALTIGDPAPAFNPEGWVKGTPVASFETGKIYVVEFWATWCGPCIASMPHLSDMADKYAGKATLISVNTWDRNQEGEKQARHQGHVDRVTKFVNENAQKMRYNIALDDEKDTISNDWMRKAGRNGIPCAFIVNGDGVIAWIGHPMQMDKPLEAVVAGTWDLQAFKATFAKEQEAALAAMKARQDVTDAAKAGDANAFNAAWAKLKAPDEGSKFLQGCQMAASVNPEFAMQMIEANMGKISGIPASSYCSLFGVIVKAAKTEELKSKAVAMSQDCTTKAEAGDKALAFYFHASLLVNAGNKTDAKDFVAKAKASINDCPEQMRKGLENALAALEKKLG